MVKPTTLVLIAEILLYGINKILLNILQQTALFEQFFFTLSVKQFKKLRI